MFIISLILLYKETYFDSGISILGVFMSVTTNESIAMMKVKKELNAVKYATSMWYLLTFYL